MAFLWFGSSAAEESDRKEFEDTKLRIRKENAAAEESEALEKLRTAERLVKYREQEQELFEEEMEIRRKNVLAAEHAEHEYHSLKQKLDTEIAKKENMLEHLEKEIQSRKNTFNEVFQAREQAIMAKSESFNECMQQKDAEIARLQKTVEKLIERTCPVQIVGKK